MRICISETILQKIKCTTRLDLKTLWLLLHPVYLHSPSCRLNLDLLSNFWCSKQLLFVSSSEKQRRVYGAKVMTFLLSCPDLEVTSLSYFPATEATSVFPPGLLLVKESCPWPVFQEVFDYQLQCMAYLACSGFRKFSFFSFISFQKFIGRTSEQHHLTEFLLVSYKDQR